LKFLTQAASGTSLTEGDRVRCLPGQSWNGGAIRWWKKFDSMF